MRNTPEIWIFFHVVICSLKTSRMGSVKVKKSMMELAIELARKHRIGSRHLVVGSA